MIAQVLCSVVASAGFAILFQAPPRRVAAGALAGGLGWALYLWLVQAGADPFAGTFAAALLVGLLSEWLARLEKDAARVFTIPGIIPLVPGTTVYQAHLAALTGHVGQAGRLAAETVLYGVAIAVGLAMARWLVQEAGAGRRHCRS